MFLEKFDNDNDACYISEFIKTNVQFLSYLGHASLEVVDYVFYVASNKR